MSDDCKAVFFLNHNNDADQITPIIYKLAERGKVPIDVVLWKSDIKESDYRLKMIDGFEDVTVHSYEDTESKDSDSFKKRLSEGVKYVGKAAPTNIPELVYNGVMDVHDRMKEDTESEKSKEVLETTRALTEGYDRVAVALDWTMAFFRRDQMSQLKGKKGYTTVVLPHGDAPFQNAMEQQWLHFETLLEDKKAFTERVNLDRIAREAIFGTTASCYDYHVMPNKANARRMEPFVDESQIKVLGSPRYNREWLGLLSEHRPDHELSSAEGLGIVMFNRGDIKYNILNIEVENTIRLVARFPNVRLIVKEHPRYPLIDSSSELRNISNVKIIDDEVSSATLVDWGDVFFELGTTIAFEPVMRGKPVFSLSYTHPNYATIAHYFSNSNMRCKDDLYYALHEFIDDGCPDFYDEEERERFIREMITSGHDSVLDAHADFIMSCLEDDEEVA